MCTRNLTIQMVCYTKPSGKLEKVWKRVDNLKKYLIDNWMKILYLSIYHLKHNQSCHLNGNYFYLGPSLIRTDHNSSSTWQACIQDLFRFITMSVYILHSYINNQTGKGKPTIRRLHLFMPDRLNCGKKRPPVPDVDILLQLFCGNLGVIILE